MSSLPSESGQATGLVLVGLMLLAIPAGLAVALEHSTTAPDQSTIPTVTPPLLSSPTPTETPTGTATPTTTSTATPTHDGDDNETDGDGNTTQTHFVNIGGGAAEGGMSEGSCASAKYTTIQAAVDTAEPSDTVAVCAGTYIEHVEVTTANLTIRAIGNATITNANESAVWINAPEVALQGFTLRVGESANYAIEVGGKKAVIRNNIVYSPLVGIFLSDGSTETGDCRIEDRETVEYNHFRCDQSPTVDSNLGAATGGRVLNNSVSAGMLRIWVDANSAVIQNNFVTGRKPEDPPNYPECRTNNAIDPCTSRFNDSIVSSGNDTIIRGNTIQIEKRATGIFHTEAGIMIGKTPTRGHNMATNNTVVANSISSPLGAGIKTRNVTAGTHIRANSITGANAGIWVMDQAIVRNNNLFPNAQGECSLSGMRIVSFRWAETRNYEEKGVLVINNTLDGGNTCLAGVTARWTTHLKGNTIKNYLHWGIMFGICPGGTGHAVNNRITGMDDRDSIFDAGGIKIGSGHFKIPCPSELTKRQKRIEMMNNQLTSNENGIIIKNHSGINPSVYEIHDNVINNNEDLGIWNRNDSVILNAKNNIWDCGGPSSGPHPLADPYTGRPANGSGDLISAGNGSTRNGYPMSNVHFDPFQVQNPSSCSGTQPTPTDTPTPTPTPTTAPPLDGNDGDGDGPGRGDETGTGDGEGSGAGDGNGTGSGDGGASSGEGNDGSDGEKATSLPSPTSTLTATIPSTSTPTPTATVSPTPVVEPGFGVLTWLVGVALLLGLLAGRRWPPRDGGEDHG